MRVTRMMWYTGTLLVAVAMLAATATVSAQQRARTAPGRTGGAASDSTRAQRDKASSLRGFRGTAAKLHTTPAALQSAFERARQANPKLSRGNFIAANVLADNLGAKHPRITTRAILAGLQSGKSMGQTLQSLGLSKADAKQARKDAGRHIKDAERRIKDADKRAHAARKAAK